MEQINYDKLQYDIIRNKHFTMIEPLTLSKHISTLKDHYRYQQRLQILRLDQIDIPKNQTEHFSRNISKSFRL